MLNNKVNLPYDPQTITIATKHKKLLKVKKCDPRSGVLTKKQVYLQNHSMVVEMKRNQKYQRFNKYNISD